MNRMFSTQHWHLAVWWNISFKTTRNPPYHNGYHETYCSNKWHHIWPPPVCYLKGFTIGIQQSKLSSRWLTHDVEGGWSTGVRSLRVDCLALVSPSRSSTNLPSWWSWWWFPLQVFSVLFVSNYEVCTCTHLCNWRNYGYFCQGKKITGEDKRCLNS